MACPTEHEMRDLAAGLAPGRHRRRILRHFSHCSYCREQFGNYEEEAIGSLLLLAEDQDLTPEDPRALRNRIFAAIERDRAARRAPSRFRRAAPRLALAASLAVLLLWVGVLLLGEKKRWIGHLEVPSGALALQRINDGRLLPLPELETTTRLAAGDVYVLPAGSTVDLTFDRGASVRVEGPAVFGLNGSSGAARLVLGAGVVRIDAAASHGLPVYTGQGPLYVEGGAEISVEADFTASATKWVVDATASARDSRKFRFVGDANAAEPDDAPSGSVAGVVSVRTLYGEVRSRDGTVLAAQRIGTLEESKGWTSSSKDEEAVSFLDARPDAFSRQEMEAAARLLRRDEDAVAGLLEAARDESRPHPERALAVHLLGDLGDPAVLGELRELRGSDYPTAVRATAVHALSRFREAAGDWFETIAEREEDAVSEAWVLALPRVLPSDDAFTRLVDLASDPTRTAFLRALCASLAHRINPGENPGLTAALEDIHRSLDPDAARIADRLLGARPSPTSTAILLTAARFGTIDQQKRAFEFLRNRQVPELPSLARQRFDNGGDQTLRARALPCLLSSDPDDREELINRALSDPNQVVREAALQWVFLNRPDPHVEGHVPLPQEHLDHIESLLSRAELPPVAWEQCITILAELGRVEPVLESLASPSAYRREHALWVLTAPLDMGGELPPAHRAAIQSEVARLMGDEDEGVKAAAWRCRLILDPEAGFRELAARLETPEPLLPGRLTEIVLDTHSRGEEPAATEQLFEVAKLLLESDDPALRHLATRLMSGILWSGVPGADQYIARKLAADDLPRDLRVGLVADLASGLNSPVVRQSLKTALESESPAVARSAAVALFELHFVGRLPESLQASEIRGNARDPLAMAVLAVLDPVDTELARRALARGSDRADIVLLSCLTDEQLRLPALSALARTLSSADSVTRTLAELRLRSPEATRLRSILKGLPQRAVGTAIRTWRRTFAEDDTSEEASRALGSALRDDYRLAGHRRISGSSPIRAATRKAFNAQLMVEARRDAARARAFLETGSVVDRSHAAEFLSRRPSRVDLDALVLTAAEPSRPDVQRRALRSILEITGRSGVGQTRFLPRDLAAWWRDRAYAFDVPQLKQVFALWVH